MIRHSRIGLAIPFLDVYGISCTYGPGDMQKKIHSSIVDNGNINKSMDKQN